MQVHSTRDSVIINDPRLVSKEFKTPVLRGCTEVLYKQWDTAGVGGNQIAFNCVNTAPNVEIDRNINLLVPVRLTLTMQNVPAGSYILNPNMCNLRSFPLQKSMESVSLTINNHAVTLKMGEIQSALELFNNGSTTTLRNLEYSKCPTYGCNQSQAFNNLPQGTRSPLSPYIDSVAGVAPQSFPFTIVSQTTPAGPAAGEATAVLDFVSVESIWLSPLYWGLADGNIHALCGITTMDFNFQFYANAGFRMIAINNADSSIPLGAGPITVTQQYAFQTSDNFSYPETRPKILMQLLKPQIAVPMTGPFTYQHYEIATYTTAQSSAVVGGALTTVQSLPLSLPRLPSKILIFARKPMSTFLQDPFTPDTFMAVRQLQIQWNNKLVLSTAHPSQIYDMSVKNGLQMDYTSWSGYGINNNSPAPGFGTAAQQFAGLGSPIWVGPLDLGITPEMSQEPHIQIQLQVTAVMQNISVDTFTPEIVIATLTDGALHIHDGQVTTELGIIQTQIAEPIKKADPTVAREPAMSVWKQGKAGLGGSTAFKESLKHLFRKR
jgi:hypothetical protein